MRLLTILLILGAITTLLGVGGLAYCILSANSLRKQSLDTEEMTRRLQRLIPINLASVFVCAIGLMMVVMGRLL